MSDTSDRSLSRRRLLGTGGALAGAGAAALIGGSASASPARRGTPFIHRQADTVKLTMWHQYPESLDPFKKLIADFPATNPGIEIDISMPPTDQWQAKIKSALNTGSGPD